MKTKHQNMYLKKSGKNIKIKLLKDRVYSIIYKAMGGEKKQY